jgi:hypothetical protein
MPSVPHEDVTLSLPHKIVNSKKAEKSYIHRPVPTNPRWQDFPKGFLIDF